MSSDRERERLLYTRYRLSDREREIDRRKLALDYNVKAEKKINWL